MFTAPRIADGRSRFPEIEPPMSLVPRTIMLAVVAGLSLLGFQEARDSITAEEIRAHLFLLSSDRLEGREPGTRGADIAADYIASQFIRMGLEPVDGSYFQDVPLTGITTDPTTVSLAFDGGETRTAARYPDDAVIWPGAPNPAVQISGELVFVGYGVDAPAWGWDDFEGRDLNGKTLLFLVGDPPAPPDEPTLFDGQAMTYYGRWTYKIEEARRRGATGALILHRPEAAGYPWSVVRSSWTGEHLMLEDEGQGPPVLLQGWISQDFARTALAQAGLDLDELIVRAARRDFRPVPTGLTVRARMNSRSRQVQTRNVVGHLPGRDPDRGEEVVIFTSHYDHLGIGPAVDGDSIYNGAYDNASGVSLLLEVADAFARLGGTDRGTLFMATTAEESGLLGARHYVAQPLFPLDRTAAALNIDGANLWGETVDAIAVGGDRSTLGQILLERARDLELDVRGDPAPESGGFFRSDQFAFAEAGVPSLLIQHGLEFRGRRLGWGDSVLTAWDRDHYHRPSDELPPDPDLAGAVQQGRLIFGVGYDVANAPELPEWREGVPFKIVRGRTVQ